jgi:hypothetical protein
VFTTWGSAARAPKLLETECQGPNLLNVFPGSNSSCCSRAFKLPRDHSDLFGLYWEYRKPRGEDARFLENNRDCSE